MFRSRATEGLLLAVLLSGGLAAQTATKLRVLAAPGITTNDPKDWKNTLAPDGAVLRLTCPKCEPEQTISVPAAQVSGLRYGDNAYHHWATGAVTAFFTLGIGAIVGFMPHHQHFFSIDLKSGKVIAIQADKGNYKLVAGMLQNLTGLPFEVAQKDAHFLSGFNVQVDGSAAK